jgi:four helix bundle protein
MFDHEKLDVYQLQIQFVGWVTILLDDLAKETKSARTREVRGQLDRASLSVLLNVAEGNGKRYLKARAKFLDDARGSATECAACLDALVAKRACAPERTREGKELLVRVAAMLTKLILRLEADSSTTRGDQKRPSQPRPSTKRPFEHEYEYENENENQE